MAMKVTKNNVHESFEEAKRKIEEIIIRNLQSIGTYAVNIARDNTQPKKNKDGSPGGGTSYLDDTGNLRSSIGYIILKNGEIVDDSKFPQTKGTATEGKETGYSAAKRIASEYSNKYVLVIVAGMNYASYVEKKDYDVLTFTESEARRKAKDLFNNLKI